MKLNPELLDDENPEWTAADFKNAVPFSALPESLQTTLLGLKKNKTSLSKKISMKVHFEREVIEAFRASGKGWQTRMNDALKEWLKYHVLVN